MPNEFLVIRETVDGALAVSAHFVRFERCGSIGQKPHEKEG